MPAFQQPHSPMKTIMRESKRASASSSACSALFGRDAAGEGGRRGRGHRPVGSTLSLSGMAGAHSNLIESLWAQLVDLLQQLQG